MCFDIWADYWCPQTTAGAVTALVRVNLSAALHLSTPHWAAAHVVICCPQQSPCDLQELGRSTGLAEPQQHRKTEVSHTQTQKTSCNLVNQIGKPGGLCPTAGSLKMPPSTLSWGSTYTSSSSFCLGSRQGGAEHAARSAASSLEQGWSKHPVYNDFLCTRNPRTSLLRAAQLLCCTGLLEGYTQQQQELSLLLPPQSCHKSQGLSTISILVFKVHRQL